MGGIKKKLGGFAVGAIAIALSSSISLAAGEERQSGKDTTQPFPHNVILFVTDGLRHDSVTLEYSPTIYGLRQEGVDFANSHSLFPTVTTANASALATGHGLGDTGNFANSLFDDERSCQQEPRHVIFNMENNFDLALLNCLHTTADHEGVYLGVADTLISLARAKGYNTAVVGKLGPTAIQDVSDVRLNEDLSALRQPRFTIIVDIATGHMEEKDPRKMVPFPIPDRFWDRMPRENGKMKPAPGNGDLKTANAVQQEYFTDVVVGTILPEFAKDFFEQKKGFFLVFWSADPDRTQHNQEDSPDKLEPGINGLNSKLAIHNADQNLTEILKGLKALKLVDHTDIIVAADHGFSTISKGALDASGFSQMKNYSAGVLADPEPQKRRLPPGFLAFDLAHILGMDERIYDPSKIQGDPNSPLKSYLRVDPRDPAFKGINGSLIGGTGKVLKDKTDAEIITQPSGNSELIYFPQIDPNQDNSKNPLAAKICDFLTQQDYIDGVFVRHDLGEIPGTLPLLSIGLDDGSARLPTPAIIINFKGFALDPHKPWSTWVQIADTTLKQGQGQHGGLNRADTFNNIIAKGPDFRGKYRDLVPVSNADVAQTIAHILKLDRARLNSKESKWEGRVLYEALTAEAGGHDPPKCTYEIKCSKPTDKGFETVLEFQTLNQSNRKFYYFDEACGLHTDQDKDSTKCRYSDQINHGSCKAVEPSCTPAKPAVPRKKGKVRKIVAGGQTGADQAGLRAARRAALKTGGWCPPGCKSLDGDVPRVFDLKETPEERSTKAPEVARSLRTEWNVRESDATLILTLRSVIDDRSASEDRSLKNGCTKDPAPQMFERDPGTAFTIECAKRYTRPLLVCDVDHADTEHQIESWIENSENQIETLNVAGPAEINGPGIGQKAEALLCKVFDNVGEPAMPEATSTCNPGDAPRSSAATR